MSTNYHSEIEAFMDRVSLKNAHEPEFLQAVQEVVQEFFDQEGSSAGHGGRAALTVG